MTKKISAKSHKLRLLVWAIEGLFILVVPIYLFGWLKGLLIHSALSSLLHIAALLCGMMPRYVVVKQDGTIISEEEEITKQALKEARGEE